MMSGQSSRDGFQRLLDDIVDDAVTLLERRASQEPLDEELLESSTQYTVIVHFPGLRQGQIRAMVLEQSLIITAPGLTVCRPLKAEVDAQSLVTTYLNGVLSARVRKA